MKEVEVGHYAGPYDETEIPYEYFVQSPIGLVPKAGGKTCLIFHLSFDFSSESTDKSINYHTPDEFCSVTYSDLDVAVWICLDYLE